MGRKLSETILEADYNLMFRNPPNRGFLAGYPDDVVAIVNGRAITKTHLLNGKRARQRKQLAAIRHIGPIAKPGFAWVFRNSGFPYGGWWLYVLTAQHSWEISYRCHGTVNKFAIPIMQLYPCGLLPMRETFKKWMPIFAETYHRPTKKRPTDNGLALIRVVVDRGSLLDVKT